MTGLRNNTIQESPHDLKERALSAMQAVSSNLPRPDWVKVSIAIKTCGVGFDDWASWCEQGWRTPMTSRELHDQWQSFTRYSVGPGYLFRVAINAGWRDPTAETRERTFAARRTFRRPAIVRDPPQPVPDEDETAQREMEQRATSLWQAAAPAEDAHPYLARKGIPATGLRALDVAAVTAAIGYRPFSKRGELEGMVLLVPLREPGGAIRNIELIDAAGRKVGLKGCKRKGHVFCPRYTEIANAPILGFAEGVATAGSLAAACGYPVISVGSCGLFLSAMEAVAEVNPRARFVVFADLGNGEESARKAAAAMQAAFVAPPAWLAEPYADLPEGGNDFNDLTVALGQEGVATYVRHRDRHPTWVDVRAAATAPVPVDYVLPGLAVGEVGLLVGQGAIGKSMLCLSLGVGYALGRNYLDLSGGPESPFACMTEGGAPVTLLFGEDAAHHVHNRLNTLFNELNLSDEDITKVSERLTIRSLPGIDMRMVEQSREGLVEGAFRGSLERLARGRRLLVVDPLVRLHDADEADNAVASHLMLQLQQISAASGCATILLHHVSKAGGSDWRAARGASAYSTSVRWQMMMRPPSEQEIEKFGWQQNPDIYVHGKVVKANNTGPLRELWWRKVAGGLLLEFEPELTGLGGAEVLTGRSKGGAKTRLHGRPAALE